MLKFIETVLLFVTDIDTAAKWYAEIFDTSVQFENAQYAFIRTPNVLIGFHPADTKCPGGVGGSVVYWEVDDINQAVKYLQERGAVLYRGPIKTDFGAEAAILIDPFGCLIGLNHSTEASLRAINKMA